LTDLVLPVFEPVRLTRRTPTGRTPEVITFWRRTLRARRRFALIVNSERTESSPTLDEVISFIDAELSSSEAVIPALMLRKGTDPGTILEFSEYYSGCDCIVIHRNHEYVTSELEAYLQPIGEAVVHLLIDRRHEEAVRELPGRGRVLLHDGFRRRSPNTSYRERSDFACFLHDFRALGYDGFGDFTVVGDVLRSGGGGNKYAIAVHLAEVLRRTVHINHFVSSSPDDVPDWDRRFREVVDKIRLYGSQRSGFDTVGVETCLMSAKCRTRDPSFWGILHHLEIMQNALTDRGALPSL